MAYISCAIFLERAYGTLGNLFDAKEDRRLGMDRGLRADELAQSLRHLARAAEALAKDFDQHGRTPGRRLFVDVDYHRGELEDAARAALEEALDAAAFVVALGLDARDLKLQMERRAKG